MINQPNTAIGYSGATVAAPILKKLQKSILKTPLNVEKKCLPIKSGSQKNDAAYCKSKVKEVSTQLERINGKKSNSTIRKFRL